MSPKWLARVGGLIALGCRGTGATPTPPPPAATPPTLEVAPVPAGRAEPEPVVATNDTDASDAEASSIDASPPATTEACLRCCDAESRSCDRGCPDGEAGRGCLRRCGSRRVGCRSACKTAPTPCDLPDEATIATCQRCCFEHLRTCNRQCKPPSAQCSRECSAERRECDESCAERGTARSCR